MQNEETTQAPHGIVLCHLESLVCLPALNRLFAQFGSKIDLVLGSNRFGSSHGGVMRQFLSGVRRMGWRQTLYLGFDIVGDRRSLDQFARRFPQRYCFPFITFEHGY